MCQLIFVVACVLPTAWVVLRIAYQPGTAHFAQQLQLQLGVPVRLEQVTTPAPELTVLHGVSFQHPESGTWAKADRWSLVWADSPQHTRWQIDRLQVAEATLPDLFEHLHRTVVRQHLAVPDTARGTRMPALPQLHIQSLEVLSSQPPTSSAATVPPLALLLKDVTLAWQWNATTQRPRLEVAAKLQPPRRERDVLSAGVAAPEVPLLCYLERRPESQGQPRAADLVAADSPEDDSAVDDDAPRSKFVTHWEVAVLERPVPVAWIHLQAWPAALRSASTAARFQGLLTGSAAERGWRVDCHQARAEGWDLSDLEFALTGRRSRTQAPLDLRIEHMVWIGRADDSLGWDSARLASARVEFSAENGELAADLVLDATRALTLPAANPAVRQVSHAVVADETRDSPTLETTAGSDQDPLSHLSVRFAQLQVGVRWQDGQLWLRPLAGNDGPLPLVLGYHGQDLVGWSDAGERLWQAEPIHRPRPVRSDMARPLLAGETTGATAPSNEAVDEGAVSDTGESPRPLGGTPTAAADLNRDPNTAAAQPVQWVEPREPLRIAPVDLAWQPQQFIVGERLADPFPFDALTSPHALLREQLEKSALDSAGDR